ncbi:hypothetical protein AWC38_SpisGene19884 [Stylophora pistillata]|uniref:Uncharacterized protein n=1 Tax=Stylophora pistillata TaxID=50429 RepID=A0A2B4RFC9_STYPI|nr:hypothetical protein AWC38_SpisGene19884 [Stylophora pistillata]
MELETEAKSLEKRLKKDALALACTLTPPTPFVTPEPPDEGEESLEEKVRRRRHEGEFYQRSDDEETSGNQHYNNRILFAIPHCLSF